VLVDICLQLHPHMKTDQHTPPIWVFDSPSSYKFLEFGFPSNEAILEVMGSINKLREYGNNQSSILLDSKPMRFNTMSLNPRLGAFPRESSEMPCIYHFSPHISFSELSTKLCTLPHTEYQCFVPHLS
jgi:hypothetical protein